MPDFSCESDTPFNNYYKGAAYINDLYKLVSHSASGVFYERTAVQIGEYCEQHKLSFSWCPEYTPIEGFLYDMIDEENRAFTVELKKSSEDDEKTVYTSETISINLLNYLTTQTLSQIETTNNIGNCFIQWVYLPLNNIHTINSVKSYDFKVFAVNCNETTNIFDSHGNIIGHRGIGYIYIVINNVKVAGDNQLGDYIIKGPSSFQVTCGNPPLIIGGEIGVLSSQELRGYNLRVM